MKNLPSIAIGMIYFLILMCLAAFAFGQAPIKLVKERVGNTDILKNWKVGETKDVNKVEVLRVSGENDYDNLTNVFYTPKSLINNLIDEKSELENLTVAAKNELFESYETKAPGGQVALFYCRPSGSLAAPTNFTIQVLNEDETEVVSIKSLKNEQPYYYKWGIWYFYKTINVPESLSESFVIKVYDKGIDQSFTFKVFGNEVMKEVDDQLLTIN